MFDCVHFFFLITMFLNLRTLLAKRLISFPKFKPKISISAPYNWSCFRSSSQRPNFITESKYLAINFIKNYSHAASTPLEDSHEGDLL
jgi:hypothetical protein